MEVSSEGDDDTVTVSVGDIEDELVRDMDVESVVVVDASGVWEHLREESKPRHLHLQLVTFAAPVVFRQRPFVPQPISHTKFVIGYPEY